MITETRSYTLTSGVTVCEIAGRLHMGNLLISVESSLDRLIQQGARKLVLDLTRLDFIDSAGIGTLVTVNGRLETAGGRMRIAGARGAVAKAFGIVQMSKIVPLDADVATAETQLNAIAG